jgi:hypothetical protein
MRDDVEIKQIPTTDQWAVIKTGVELTQENVAENVYNVFKSKELADKWLDENTRTSGGVQTVDLGVRGLFGHTRIWKATDPNSPEYGIRYIAEIQSDAFQNLDRRIATTQSEIDNWNREIKDLKEQKIQQSKINDDIRNDIEQYKNLVEFLRGKSKLKSEMVKDKYFVDNSIAGRKNAQELLDKHNIQFFLTDEINNKKSLYYKDVKDGWVLDTIGLIQDATAKIKERKKR